MIIVIAANFFSIGVTTRSILSREDKGKGKMVDDGLPSNGIDQAEDLGLKPRVKNADGNAESADGMLRLWTEVDLVEKKRVSINWTLATSPKLRYLSIV